MIYDISYIMYHTSYISYPIYLFLTLDGGEWSDFSSFWFCVTIKDVMYDVNIEYKYIITLY